MENNQPRLSTILIVLMSVATRLAVASNYYVQPLLYPIANAFSLSINQAGFIVTAAQLGYAAGSLFLVPLGDMFERRRLIVTMTLLAAGGMLITATSQSLWVMILDLTVQGVHITNQSVIYHMMPEARNRLTAGYMTSYFIGGAAGSLISSSAYQHAGWSGVCIAGATVSLLGLLVWWCGYHKPPA